MYRSLITFIIVLGCIASGCAEQREVKRFEGAKLTDDNPFSASLEGRYADAFDGQDGMSEAAGELTLREAIRLTLMNNPELKIFSYEIRAAQARQLQTGLRPNPKLNIEFEDFGGSGDSKGFDEAETTIQLFQLVETAGKFENRERAAAFNSAIAQWDYQAKKLDVFSEVTKAYIELLFIQRKKELSEELVANWKEIADTVDRRVEAGRDSPLELLKAKVSLAKGEIQHNEIVKFYDLKRQNLSMFWANSKPVFTHAAGDLEQLGDIPELEAMQNMLQNNPDVRRWIVEIQKRQTMTKLAKSQATPDFTIKGGIKHSNGSDNSSFVIGLSIPLPIANRYQGARLEAIENLSKAKEQERAAYLNAWNRLNKLYAELANSHEKATIIREKILKASEEILARSKKSYAQGRMDYLGLLDSQRTYFESKDEYIDALAEYHITKTEIERLTGQKLEDITN